MEHTNALHGQNTEFLILNLTLLVVTTMCELEQELLEWHCGAWSRFSIRDADQMLCCPRDRWNKYACCFYFV